MRRHKNNTNEVLILKHLQRHSLAIAPGSAGIASTHWQTSEPDPDANGDGSCDRSAGLVYEPWNTTLTFWGRNVFDAEATTIADTVAQDGRFIACYKEPATWSISVRKDF